MGILKYADKTKRSIIKVVNSHGEIIVNMKDYSIMGDNHIALILPYDIDTIALIKEIEGRKWSAFNKLWHLLELGTHIAKNRVICLLDNLNLSNNRKYEKNVS